MTLSGTPPPKPCGFGGLGATFFGFKISAIISLYVIFFFFFVLGILFFFLLWIKTLDGRDIVTPIKCPSAYI